MSAEASSISASTNAKLHCIGTGYRMTWEQFCPKGFVSLNGQPTTNEPAGQPDRDEDYGILSCVNRSVAGISIHFYLTVFG